MLNMIFYRAIKCKSFYITSIIIILINYICISNGDFGKNVTDRMLTSFLNGNMSLLVLLMVCLVCNSIYKNRYDKSIVGIKKRVMPIELALSFFVCIYYVLIFTLNIIISVLYAQIANYTFIIDGEFIKILLYISFKIIIVSIACCYLIALTKNAMSGIILGGIWIFFADTIIDKVITNNYVVNYIKYIVIIIVIITILTILKRR